jgi:lipopolysaccharide export system permease protein
MGVLDRYIAWNLARGWILTWVVMSALFGLLAFVEELERAGGRYTVVNVTQFILYTLPQRSLDLFPVIALLGSLLALAGLNKNSEIIAMRAAGISLRRFFRAVTIPSLLLVGALYGATEYVAAPLYQQAERDKNLIRDDGKANMLEGKGIWSNSDYRFFNVRTLRHSQVPVGIYLYEFAPDGRLLEFVFARQATLTENRKWDLVGVEHKKLEDGLLVSRHEKNLEMGPFWSREELPVLPLSTAGMTLTGLFEYANYLKSTNQKSARVELIFWQKMALPLTSGMMVLLATPIGAGSGTQRSSAYGRNLAIGAGIGILFYLGSQIIHTAGPMFGIPAVMVALAPVALVTGMAGWLFRRMR